MELSRAISALVGAAVGLTAGYALWGSGDAHRALDRQVARLEAVGQQFSRLDQERRLAVASCAQSSLSPNRTANVAPPSGTVQQLAGGAPSGSNGASTTRSVATLNSTSAVSAGTRSSSGPARSGDTSPPTAAAPVESRATQ